jgi:uncharacterized protein (TIGR02996 family)
MRVHPKTEQRVRREFFPEDYAEAIQLLKRGRVHSAALQLARGRLGSLRTLLHAAEEDPRDIIMWAGSVEYSRRWQIVRAPDEPVPGPEEEGLLRAIAQKPADNAIRLVYADWLEDHGDPRAEYVRILCRWIEAPSTEDEGLIARERELRKGLGRGWLAQARGMPLLEKKK